MVVMREEVNKILQMLHEIKLQSSRKKIMI